MSPTFLQIKTVKKGMGKQNNTVASNAYFIIMISQAFFIMLGPTEIFLQLLNALLLPQ